MNKNARYFILKKVLLPFFLTALFIIPCLQPLRASFVDDIGARVQPTGTSNGFWYKAAKSVNNPGIDVITWTGWPIQSVQFYAIAAIIGYPDATGQITTDSSQNSALGKMAGLIGSMYSSQPASSAQYFAYLKEKINFGVTPVHAQGEGWHFLESPTLGVWKIMRNLSYMVFVVIFVAIGFMIMFRAKIDPQTVVSIQSALPRIIVTLIVITFSFAICGFFVDLAYLLNEFITVAILKQQPILNFWTGAAGQPLGPFHPVPLPKPPGHLWDPWTTKGYITSVDPGGLIDNFLGATAPNIFALLMNNMTMGLIFVIIILTSVFRIFLTLLSKYVTIIISTIFSPAILLFGSLPGQKDHFSKFFRTYLSAVLSFPIVYLLLNLAAYFLIAGSRAYYLKFYDLKPLDLEIALGGMKAAGTAAGGQLVALGIILMIPSVPGMIDDALAVKPSEGMEQIGAGVGGALRKIPGIGALLG